jgi:hypothetical protein
VVFAIGETSKPITVEVTGDRLAELAEDFFVNLSAPTNAALSDSQGVGTILDDEPLISIDSMTVTEGNAGTVNATFTVTLSAAYDEVVTVPFATRNGDAKAGTDYTGATGNVTFGIGETSKPITISVIGDRRGEQTEDFWVDLTAPANAALGTGSGYAAILDDEPRISIDSRSKREGQNGKVAFVFTVTLSAPSDQAVTVKYATRNDSARPRQTMWPPQEV